MKKLSWLPLFIIAVGCINSDTINEKREIPLGFKSQRISLDNNLGNIQLFVPNDLDTFYSWIRYSDYSCGHKQMYRFSDRRFQLIKESGWIFNEKIDSLKQITVSHALKSHCKERFASARSKKFEENLKYQFGSDSSRKEIKNINGRDFYILTFTMESEARNIKNVTAITIIDSIRVDINFNCYAKDCKEFTNRINKSIESITIEKL